MRQHKILTIILLLEVLALVLAYVQFSGGLVSDEAKYLLSIPYPHPPFLRSFMGFTTEMPGHEFVWRFVFASLLLQAVWFVWDLGDVLSNPRRLTLAASWLLSSAVILQSGMIVMATGAALSGLIFLWWTLHPAPPRKPAMLGLLWLMALFTAYQSAIYAPLVLSALLRSERSKMKVFLYLCVPILLICLYSLTNPHALTIMFAVSGEEMVIPPLTRFFNIGWVWIVAGSGLLSIIGTVGILSSVRLDIVTTFGLLLGFIILTTRYYDAVLFTPLLIGGLFLLFCKRRLNAPVFLVGQAVCAGIIVFLSFPTFRETPARAEMKALSVYQLTGDLLIDGFFGHDWQYESPFPVRRFSQGLSAAAEAKAGIFVCTKPDGCEDSINDELWTRLPHTPLPTWVRKTPGS
ncbi:MAG: hypothetical protein KBA40_03050 [Candidatus Peribacteraceae bacterium]|nr:hypothetical protein [Candidatus Peribacteraceae bacterium]